MPARSRARKRALDVLFEAEQRGVDPLALAAQRVAGGAGTDGNRHPMPEFAVALVEGVVAHRELIDALLSEHSHGWTLDRMPAVDRTVLRMAAYELLYDDAVPDAVALDEAVSLVASLSTDDSPSFVNGLLGRLHELKPTLVGAPVPASPPAPGT